MALKTFDPSPDSDPVTADNATADVGATSDPTAAEDGAVDGVLATSAAEDPAGIYRNTTPSEADLDQEYFYRQLRAIVPGEFFTWERYAQEVAKVAELARDARSFELYLLALMQAMLEDLAQIPYEIAKKAKTRIELQFQVVYLALVGLFLAGGGLPLLLVHDKDLRENLAQLFQGLLDGLSASGVLSAKMLQTYFTNTVGATVLMPLTAFAYVAGAMKQVWDDMMGAMELVWKGVGNFASLDQIALDGLKMFGKMLRGLLEAGGTELYDFGLEMGREIGTAMVSSLGMELDLKQPVSLDNFTKIMTFSFNLGTYTGQLAIDLLLSITGLEFVVGAGKILKAGGKALARLQELVLALVRRVDSGLADELLTVAAKVGAQVNARIARWASDMGRLGYDEQALVDGFEVVHESLGEEGYRRYVSCVFCSLKDA